MKNNRPEYEETPRMTEFRRRKEKELRRRRRNKRLVKLLVVVILIWVLAAVAAAAFHLINGFGFLGKKEQNETQTSQEEITSQASLSESAQEVDESESDPTSLAETIQESVAESAEEDTQDGTSEPVESVNATKSTTSVKKHEDPREDVWNHYTNMFIASKVNTYLNVRNQPTTDGTIIGKLTKYSGGELVENLGNGWWHILSGGIDGYIWSENCVTGDEAKQVALEHCMQMVEVTTEKLNVRSGPGLEYDVWTTLNASEKQVVEERDGDWLKISFNSTYGYINADYVKTGFYLVEAIPWSSIADCSPTRQQILTFGEQYIGTTYVYGGTSLTGGIDCSSFVQQCYASAGFSLPRTSREQATRGTQITLAEAKPGDLLFYADATGTIDHVVMYLGDGKILHAAQSLGQVTISKYNYSTEPVRVVNIIGE